jgi:hypothetical protein
MSNAWRCIGPGTTERDQGACSSCPPVVLHEPGLVRLFAGRRSFAPAAASPGLLHVACIGLDPASYPDWPRNCTRFLANIVEAAWMSRSSKVLEAFREYFTLPARASFRKVSLTARASSVECCG